MLLGYGESSDAHHMSHPHPEGKGAIVAMDLALERSGLPAEAIDYINLHGTASKANDLVETYALAQRFPHETLASSTKGWTGHTLGAAGMVEVGTLGIAGRRLGVPGVRRALRAGRPTGLRWELCSRVPAQRDIVDRLSTPW